MGQSGARLVAELNQRFRFQLSPCASGELRALADEFDVPVGPWLAGDARIAEIGNGDVPDALIVHTTVGDESRYGLYVPSRERSE
jgi:hypothetical protein